MARQTTALTSGEPSCDQPRWSPDGKQIAYLSKKGGKRDLWLIAPEGGEAKRLTKFDRDISSYQWSPDGKRIAYTVRLDPQTQLSRSSRSRRRTTPAWWTPTSRRAGCSSLTQLRDAKPKVLTPNGMSVGGVARQRLRLVARRQEYRLHAHHARRGPTIGPPPTCPSSMWTAARSQPLAQTPAAEIDPLFARWPSHRLPAQRHPAHLGRHDRAGRLPVNGGYAPTAGRDLRSLRPYTDLIGWSADSKQLYFTECTRHAR